MNSVNTTACVGDQLEVLRSFKNGELPFVVQEGKTAVITAINFGASTASVISQHNDKCGAVFNGAPYRESCEFQLSQTLNPQPVRLAGTYKLILTPPNEDAVVDIQYIDADCCAIQLACPAVVVAPPAPPVTAAVTGLPCPLPASFMYNGAATTLSAFIADIKAQVSGATWTGCGFSAPAPAVFPPLAVSAIVVVPPPVVYCPSQPLLDGGFGYHIADPKDPAATVEIAACAGGSADSIWVYPTAGAGHTAKVMTCDGVTIGYGMNKSDCAVTCPCPDMNVTVNNAAPVNNVSVAAPNVTIAPAVNNFAPTNNVAAPTVTNNFAPTTTVAAPNVVMPPAPLTSATIAGDGAITLVSTNAAGQQTTVVSNPLPSC